MTWYFIALPVTVALVITAIWQLIKMYEDIYDLNDLDDSSDQ